MMLSDSSADAQLQQELREMFLVDTQQQLELYFDIVQQLQPRSWIGDIQSIYRAIHTIKGGAVTVDANSMLYGSSALEDLLSDLRYLEVAPPLSDGKLSQMLLEAGELIASCLEIFNPSVYPTADDDRRVQLTLGRLQTIHAQMKEQYLPNWNEMKQVHQEFAEQGFDLVVLELEMALAKMSTPDTIPVKTARSTIAQLMQIGTELELAPGWTSLIQFGERTIECPDLYLWQTIWLPYFEVLKACIKSSGEIAAAELDRLDALVSAAGSANFQPPLVGGAALFAERPVRVASASAEGKENRAVSSDAAISPSEDLSGLLNDFLWERETLAVAETTPDADRSEDLSGNFSFDAEILAIGRSLSPEEDLPDLLDIFFTDEETPAVSEDLPDLLDIFFTDEETPAASEDLGSDLSIAIEIAPVSQSSDEIASSEDLPDLLDSFFLDEETEIGSLDAVSPIARENFAIAEIDDLDDLAEPAELAEIDLIALIESESIATTDELLAVATLPPAAIAIASVEVKRGIAIPVPIERLDRSAQHVVDTLLTARAVKNVADRLQSQLAQLSILTQESSQFVTRVRQFQDNYALLSDLSDERDASNNVSIERYRQGYTMIVRLLENMLRMSELGQEIETTTYQHHNHLDDLDRSILRLKDGIETSRLVPFRNLTLRAKAILRDLTNRYGKPAELLVHNEQVELDAGIVQQLEPALLHLLRNAYDHGLETATQRLAAGKPERGTISVSLQRRGNLYRLEVEDDGSGIDANEIERIAKSKGFATAKIVTTNELLAVLCQPGFSSSSTVSAVSGRGVGMDVVVAQIASIGGKLSLETNVGRGTKFTIEIPVPQLLVPCILFQVGDRTIAFPTEEVLETALLSSLTSTMSADAAHLYTWTLTTSRGDVAGFDLANYWQSTDRALPDTAVCIRTRQGESSREIWSIADDLLGQAELLIKPLPSPLIAPAGLLGVSLQSDGRLISILDPIALTTKLATSVDRRATDYSLSTVASERPKSSAPVILIVDDAALMRRRFEASLHTYGFVTHTCNDGLEALHWLENNPHPDLMITDVEMPNMDGFTLIDRVRQAQIEIPILVVSSRSSEEWGKEARRLGASDYLNKGFSTAEMLQKVNTLLKLVVNV